MGATVDDTAISIELHVAFMAYTGAIEYVCGEATSKIGHFAHYLEMATEGAATENMVPFLYNL